MKNNRWREIERIFDATLDLPETDRAAFIAQACDGDQILQHEVESLLAAHQQANGFLASSTAPLSAKQVLYAPVTMAQRLGPYQLLREIAQGGMGTVWLAERADDHFKQQVAIKLLKTDGSEIAHRLRHERQILADLNHLNIARLLDGGTTDSGQPYLVMEYIEGSPVDAYCRQQQLGLRERLQLFRQVCAAVQYAHQHLIIHRDLKPANILVTADGTPKLLDFGIAKLLQPDLSQSYQTQAGQNPMTPAYASPEQVRSETLTTTSDVYSLGVVLYELLTGRSPYQLTTNTFGELAKAICEQEPTRPSQSAKSEVGSQKSEGKRKFTFLPTTDHRPPTTALRGDLDSIVLMALRKEPSARYPSVEQFSADIQRYLDGLPTLARKGTLAYRAVKYVRRYKVPVAAAALILLSLLSGIGATSRQAQIARAEQAKAEAQRIRAERALAIADEQRRRAEQALAEVEAQRTRAENALTTAEQRRRQAEVARTEANQQRAVAEMQRLTAETERNVAQTQRERAETQELSNRQLLYTSRMGLAHQEWENSNIGRMRELLDFYLPQADEPDLRGFDWYYLWRLCHREEKTIAGGDYNAVAYSPDGKTLLTLAITLNNSSYIAEVAFRDAVNWQTLSSQQYAIPGASGRIAASSNTDKVVVGLGSESIRVFSFSDYKEHLQI
ncbi:MAG: protein kinase, partial [Blastocatellia bacterium]|nr:protein kinase [Blastocatellia bacterium]